MRDKGGWEKAIASNAGTGGGIRFFMSTNQGMRDFCAFMHAYLRRECGIGMPVNVVDDNDYRPETEAAMITKKDFGNLILTFAVA